MQSAFVPATPLPRSFRQRTAHLHQSTPRKPRHAAHPRAQLPTTAVPDLTSTVPSSFGRGQQYPRRHVGLYELEREKIDPTTLVAESTRNETAFASAVGLITLPIVIFPAISPGLSLEAPLAAIAAVFMTGWAVDALALQGAGARAAVLALTGSGRIAAHEAGHFLVGYLLGFPVADYTLPSPRSVLSGSECGVSFSECRERGDVYRVAAAGLAGMAGELVAEGKSEGGAQDLADVARGVRACSGGRLLTRDRLEGIVRWGIIEAVQLLRQHRRAHQELANAMVEGRTVEECIAVVERFVERDVLAEEAGVGLKHIVAD